MTSISIVIPAYNNAHLISKCLDSILEQSYDNWETVVVDDGSPDNMKDVVSSYAARDSRITLVSKPVNEGRHLARKTGTEHASNSHIMYLDADDALASPDALARIAQAIEDEPCDILRFGLTAQAEDNLQSKTAQAFTAWSNATCGPLFDELIPQMSFAACNRWKIPWHVTHRLFVSDIAKKAFEMMSNARLDRAEDAYEYFVIASLAHSEFERCDIDGYLYHMGLGVTSERELSGEKFVAETQAIVDCYDAAFEYARAFSQYDLMSCAEGFKTKLIESIANDLNERVASEDRSSAEDAFVNLVGPGAAAGEFWRFVRDATWDRLVNDRLEYHDEALDHLVSRARSTFDLIDSDAERQRVAPIHLLTEYYVGLVEKRRALLDNQQDIRIFVAAHKPAAAFDSSIMQLLQVGSANSGARFIEMLHDDIGENISTINPQYCELTGQYWAWKNIDAEYYGFCHYRRYFDFSGVPHEENPWGEIEERFIDDKSQQEYGLDDATIRAFVSKYDVITTEFKDLRAFPEGFETPLDQWHEADHLRDEDLVNILALLVERHPDYQQDVLDYLTGNYACFCNMFIMRKQIFFDYCEWLFPLLDEYIAMTDTTLFSREALRTPGHLSERLLNIYLMHHERIGSGWKTAAVPCVHFLDPSPAQTRLAQPRAAAESGLPIIPIVFAADNNYVPMLTTTIHSMLENASPDYFYDITILTTDISDSNRQIMQEFLTAGRNASIQFFWVHRLLDSFELTTNNEHIGVETYYRFLIQDVLPHYDKVVYLDSDIIVKGDVAKLYDTDLGDNLVGAVTDVDYLGMLNLKSSNRFAYTKDVLEMDDPYQYFQAGVLVLNTKALRTDIPVKTWLEEAQDPRFIFNDQDILNKRCEGRVMFIDPKWNVMNNGCNRIQSACQYAPASYFDEYLEAREDEYIVHYAGAEKPWNSLTCDRGPLYWQYASETPYYEKLITLISIVENEAYRSWKQADLYEQPVISTDNFIRKIADPIMPLGSRRREVARELMQRISPSFRDSLASI